MLWWLSFVGEEGSTDGPEGFRGVLIIDAPTMPLAINSAWKQKINPGGQVLGMPMEEFPSPEVEARCRANVNRLMSLDEANAALGEEMQLAKVGDIEE